MANLIPIAVLGTGGGGGTGRTPEFRVLEEPYEFQWKYTDDDEWITLEEMENLRGPQGIQGIQGERGFQGLSGIQGLKGDKGEKGDKGDDGLKGDKGEKGDKGDQGEQGEQGEQGPPGEGAANAVLKEPNGFQGYDTLAPGTTITWYESSGVYANRPTNRTDITVNWVGENPPASGGNGAVNNVDFYTYRESA